MLDRIVVEQAPPERIASLLAPGLPPHIAARLMQSPRLAARCAQWLGSLLGEADTDGLEAGDRALALAGADTLRRVATLAGVVWHAPRVRSLVLARDIAAFIEQFGDAARDMALRHAALAPAIDARLPLGEAISCDGMACLFAWMATLPRGIDRRLRLLIDAADNVVPVAAHAAAGPGIVRTVADEVLS